MPAIAKAALQQCDHVTIFGNDYPTADGTGVRDYIHVMDLARAHLSAFKYIENNFGMNTFNVGTGQGYSVLDVINAFEKNNGIKLEKKFSGRRPGDTATCWASPVLANNLLGWRAVRSLNDMCIDAWRWYRYSQPK